MQIDWVFRALLFALVLGSSPVSAEAVNLPMRESPVPRTTDSVPHVQITVVPVPEISEELLRRVSAISGIEIQDTILSMPGALGFWIKENVVPARPEKVLRGREFAHLHSDGSLHAMLSITLAEQAVEKGWAARHPWANQRPGWEGFVMIYTPSTFEEMEVVFQLVAQSYEFVTGRDAN